MNHRCSSHSSSTVKCLARAGMNRLVVNAAGYELGVKIGTVKHSGSHRGTDI